MWKVKKPFAQEPNGNQLLVYTSEATQSPVGNPGSEIWLCCMEKCSLIFSLAVAGMPSVVMPIEA